jgi:hypothetical protein
MRRSGVFQCRRGITLSMSEPKLDWGQAEVHQAELTVALDGDLPRGWKDTFERTAELLGRGEWGKLKLKKKAVRVSGVVPGVEDKLRHFLESVVQQANAEHCPAPSESEVDEDAREGEAASEDSGGAEDAAMTERFQSFADAPTSED